ncbi:MAG: carboxypeptidase regulatory-like domain-containing protein [Planctomycetota bacterium]
MNERLALLVSLAVGLLAAGAIAWWGASGTEPRAEDAAEMAPPSPVAQSRPDADREGAAPALEGRAYEAASGVVEGLVVDAETSAPLAGATVVAVSRWERAEAGRGVTDAEGRYEVRAPHGSHDLTTWLPGYVPAGLVESAASRRTGPRIAQLVEAGSRVAGPTLRLRRAIQLRVRVVDDASGNAVPHALVQLRGRGCSVLRWAAPDVPPLHRPLPDWLPPDHTAALATDARGELDVTALPSPLPDWMICATSSGRRSGWQFLAPEGPWDLELRLVKSATLVGRVVDTSGRPEAGAWIWRSSLDPDGAEEQGAGPLPVPTDAEGNFRVEGVPPGSCTLAVRYADPDGPAAEEHVANIRAGEERAGIEIVVPVRYIVRATLLDEAESAVRDALVRIRETAADEMTQQQTTTARTDERGHVGVQMPRAGPWTVELSTPRGWAELARGIVLPAEELILRAPPEEVTAFTLQLRALDGTAIDGYRLSAFSLAGDSYLARSYHSFVARMNGPAVPLEVPGPLPLALAITAPTVDMWESERRTMLHIVRELPADGLLQLTWSDGTGFEGVVRGRDGQPIPGATIRIASAETPATAPPEKTDAQGRFRVPYAPDLDLVARVSISPPSPWLPTATPWLRHDFATGPMEVVLERGGTVLGHIETPRAVVFGHEDRIEVLWPAGEDRLELRGRAEARVQPDGGFELQGLPHDRDATWRYVGPTLPGNGLVFEAPSRSVRAGEELILRTTQALTISGRLVGEGDLGGLQLRVRELGEAPHSRPAALSSTGEFTLGGLRPTTHELLLMGGEEGELELLRLRVEAGQGDVQVSVPALAWLEVQLEPAATRAACWVRQAGAPAATSPTMSDANGFARIRVVRGRTYDVVVVASTPQPPEPLRAGHAVGVRAGSLVRVHLEPAVVMSGALGPGVMRELHDLRARRGAAVYPLQIPDGRGTWFSTFVTPGRYEIVGTDRNGRDHVLARDIEAGQRGVVVELGR